MTVESQINKKRVVGDGVTTVVSLSFKILQETDLEIYRIPDNTGVPVLVTTGFTTVLNEDIEGAVVTFSPAILDDNEYLFITNYELTQGSDLPVSGPFSEAAIEQSLDRLTLIDIQQQEQINRGLRLKTEDVLNTVDYAGLFIESEATADRQSRVLAWNAAGTGFEAGPLMTDLDELGDRIDEIDALYAIRVAISAVAAIDDDVSTVAGIAANVVTVAGLDAEITSLAAIAAAISAAAAIDDDISAVAAIAGNVTTVAGLDTEIAALGPIAADIETNAANITDIQNASENATLASQWATLTSGLVAATDYSAKEFAIGTQASTGGSAKNWAQQTGADVTGAAANSRSAKAWAQSVLTGATLGGSAKDWAQTTGGTVDGTNYSSKEHAVGTTVTTGSAKDWASKTSAAVAGGEFSAKEFAIGTQAATGGSAKNWAQQTGADVTGAAANSRSAKSWAQDVNTGATLGGSSKDWAQTTGGTVDGTNYSSKEHAIGTTTTTGSAKDWATKTSAAVTAGNYSAKEWATGTQTRGAASGGSAKDWATYTGGTVDNAEYSAKKYAQDAATAASGANYPAVTTAGGTTAYTATPAVAATHTDGFRMRIKINATNTGNATLNASALGAKKILDLDGRLLFAGELVTNDIIGVEYNTSADGGSGAWIIKDGLRTVMDDIRVTGTLANGALTPTLVDHFKDVSTILRIETALAAGTATVQFTINGTNITTGSASATTTLSAITPTGANVTAVGDIFNATLSSVSSASDLSMFIWRRV